jgi:hypothetical protein
MVEGTLGIDDAHRPWCRGKAIRIGHRDQTAVREQLETNRGGSDGRRRNQRLSWIDEEALDAESFQLMARAVILSSRSRSSVLGCGVVEDRVRERRRRAEDANAKSRRGLPDRSVSERCRSSSPWPPRMRANARFVCTSPFVDGSPLARPNSRLQPIRVSLPFCQHRVNGGPGR